MLGAGQASLEKSAHCVYEGNEKTPQVRTRSVVIVSTPVHRSSPHACAEIARYEYHTKCLLSPVGDLSRRRPSFLSRTARPSGVLCLHAESKVMSAWFIMNFLMMRTCSIAATRS